MVKEVNSRKKADTINTMFQEVCKIFSKIFINYRNIEIYSIFVPNLVELYVNVSVLPLSLHTCACLAINRPKIISDWPPFGAKTTRDL